MKTCKFVMVLQSLRWIFSSQNKNKKCITLQFSKHLIFHDLRLPSSKNNINYEWRNISLRIYMFKKLLTRSHFKRICNKQQMILSFFFLYFALVI